MILIKSNKTKRTKKRWIGKEFFDPYIKDLNVCWEKNKEEEEEIAKSFRFILWFNNDLTIERKFPKYFHI